MHACDWNNFKTLYLQQGTVPQSSLPFPLPFPSLPSLGLSQATARQLQQSVSEYEAQLEGAYTRMQAGDAPTDDIDQEWKRMVWLQETRQKEDMFRKQVSIPSPVPMSSCPPCGPPCPAHLSPHLFPQLSTPPVLTCPPVPPLPHPPVPCPLSPHPPVPCPPTCPPHLSPCPTSALEAV